MTRSATQKATKAKAIVASLPTDQTADQPSEQATGQPIGQQVSLPALAPASPERNILAQRAMLVCLSVSTWTAKKLDRKVTAETNEANNASADAGRYNKALLSKDALAKINTIAGQARTELYAHSLPWLDAGQRIMSGAKYTEFTAKFRQLRQEYETEVDAFCVNYASLVAERQFHLGDMYDPSDYPSVDRIADKFKLSVSFFPVPDVADFRLDMSSAQVAEIQERIEAQLREAMQIAQREVWQRMLAKVQHMAEKLRSYSPTEFDPNTGKIVKKASDTFRDSLIENIREIATTMPVWNITGSPELDAMAKRLIADLCDTSAEDLRLDAQERELTAQKAETIIDDIAAYLA